MAIQIKHPFTSLKGDGGDATLIRPSNWNAVHSTSMATQMLIGRLTAGAGAFEEIPLTTYMASLLAAVDNATLAAALGIFETGDVKFSFRATETAGWLKLNGGNLQVNTIGSAGSGAVLRANADTLPLYTIIWDGCANTEAPIYDSGGSATTRGANAAADFSANKRLAIPNIVGKTVIGAGAANSGSFPTTLRALGFVVGFETHTLLSGEMPTHYHDVFLNDPGHVHPFQGVANFVAATSFNTSYDDLSQRAGSLNGKVLSATTGITVRDQAGGAGNANRTATQGVNTPHNNMQPSVALNVRVKL